MSKAAWIKVTAVLKEVPLDWSIVNYVFEENECFGTLQTDQPPTMSCYISPLDSEKIPKLKVDLLGSYASEVLFEDVPEEDWSETWKQFFKPMKIGRFVIRPTWESYEIQEGEQEVVLDPGQAFGTGDHPTTRMCVEFLSKESLFGKSMADIGCGSGILSITASLCGARSVVAVDTDSLAVESAIQNLDRNGCHAQVFQGKGFDQISTTETFDVVVSNIISAAIIGLAPEAFQRIIPGGIWIVSGIIRDNWDDVRSETERLGFHTTQVKYEGEWVAARLQR